MSSPHGSLVISCCNVNGNRPPALSGACDNIINVRYLYPSRLPNNAHFFLTNCLSSPLQNFIKPRTNTMRYLVDSLLPLLAFSAFAPQHAFAAYQLKYNQHVILPPAPVIESPVAGTPSTPSTGPREFTLRHIYHKGSHKYPDLLLKADIHPDTVLLRAEDDDDAASTFSREPLRVSTQSINIERMVDRSRQQINDLLEHGNWYGEAASLPASAWTIDEIAGPNITDKESVLTFARMAANAYVEEPGDSEWEKIKGRFNYTEDFGWKEDGLRGHIYADTSNKTVVIGLKGTSMAVFDGADTTGNDKLNDNLFGSCCCGQGGQFWWKKVCDCQTSAYTCNSTCLVKSLREKSHYYHAAMDLYHNATALYPEADIWLTGHSLGGVVSSLLGLTFGLPTITFEAYPDALAASRLGLPTPPGYHIGSHQSRVQTGIYHFGHTADPVYMGTCNTASASCTLAGYAMESQCHTGATCTYDTVGDLGWRVGIGTHRIAVVIRDVIKKYDAPPKCEQEIDCVDCFPWKFYESNSSSTTTSSSSTSTKTTSRTATCLTPGWWGCLDESTTSTPVTQTSTTTVTTCLTPGWFGCKNGSTTYTETTTITTKTVVPVPTLTTTSSSSSSSSSSAAACKSPGFFGCKDPSMTVSTAPVSSSASRAPSRTSSTKSCTSADWFGLVCVDPSPVPGSSSIPTTTSAALRKEMI